MPLNPFPAKAEAGRRTNFENYELLIYGDIYTTLLINFIKIA
jgi:hypothetical protein